MTNNVLVVRVANLDIIPPDLLGCISEYSKRILVTNTNNTIDPPGVFDSVVQQDNVMLCDKTTLVDELINYLPSNTENLHVYEPGDHSVIEFNFETYLKHNPDVRQQGFDTPRKAYNHWLTYGRHEGRVYNESQVTSPGISPISTVTHVHDNEFICFINKLCKHIESQIDKGRDGYRINVEDAVKVGGAKHLSQMVRYVVEKGDYNKLDPGMSRNDFNECLYKILNIDLDDHPDLDLYEHAKTHGVNEGRPSTFHDLLNQRIVLNYPVWIGSFDDDKFHAAQSQSGAIQFTIVIPHYNGNWKYVEETIISVKNQIYTNWELIITDDGSDDNGYDELKHNLHTILSPDQYNFKLYRNKKNQGISYTTNKCIRHANGNYIVLLDQTDLLRPHTLLEYYNTIINNSYLKFIYSDEDKLKYDPSAGVYVRADPFFKPGWSPYRLRCHNYICHGTCIEASLAKSVTMKSKYDGLQDWQYFLWITSNLHPRQIYHIHKVLYSWRMDEGSYAAKPTLNINVSSESPGEKYNLVDKTLKMFEDFLSYTNIKGTIELASSKFKDCNNEIHIRYEIPAECVASIIICTRDREELLRTTVDSILNKTTYDNYEIVIVDNESTCDQTLQYLSELESHDKIQVIRSPGEFNFSKLNNLAAKKCIGDKLIFLNNDVEVIEETWLEEILQLLSQPDVGIVGAKLYYPDDTIQHAGCVMGLGGGAGHIHTRSTRDDPGPLRRLQLVQHYSCVTGACMGMSKKLFIDLGGFDEKNLAVAFNDIDLCCRVLYSGRFVLWNPYVELYHHESASRGADTEGEKAKRFQRELQYLKTRHSAIIEDDPWYNKNFTLHNNKCTFGGPR